MTDEQTNTSDTGGNETTDVSKKPAALNPLLEKSEAIAKRIEDGNAKTEELLNKREQLDAQAALGGRSVAGVETRPQTQDEKDQAAADNILTEEED